MRRPELHEDTMVWTGVPDQTTVTESWLVLVLDNGNKILSFGADYQAGDQVHLLDPENHEFAMWDQAEWTEEPEQIMGALLRGAGGVTR